MQIGAGGTTGSILGNVLDNGALAFNRSDDVTFDIISGSGSLAEAGPGNLTLTAANTYTGATTISGGTLALSGTGSIAASSGVADNGTFDIAGTTGRASVTSLSGNGTVALGGCAPARTATGGGEALRRSGSLIVGDAGSLGDGRAGHGVRRARRWDLQLNGSLTLANAITVYRRSDRQCRHGSHGVDR